MAQDVEIPEQITVASGLTDVFPTVWTFEAASEVEVSVDIGEGFVVKMEGVHYDVTPGDWLNAGADVVFRAGQRPAAGHRVRRRRRTPLQQAVAFGDLERFQPIASEAAYDRQTRMIQEVAADVGASVKVPPGEAPVILAPVAERADRMAAFDEDGRLVGTSRSFAEFDADVLATEQARAEAVAATVNKLDLNGGNANAGQKAAFKTAFGLVAQQAGAGAVERQLASKLTETALSVNDFADPLPGNKFSAAQNAAGFKGQAILAPPGAHLLDYPLGGLNNWFLWGKLTFTGAGAAAGLPGAIFQLGGVTNPGETETAPADPIYIGRWDKLWVSAFSGLTGRVSPLSTGKFVVHAPAGNIAITGWSRSSENSAPGYDEGGIAGFFGVDNDRTSPQKGMYGLYVDAIRRSGAGTTHGGEIDAINMGTTVSISPSNMFVDGLTDCLWLASGGGTPGAQPISTILALLNNGATSDKGITHHENAYVSDVAQALARFHKTGWYDAAGTMVAHDRSDTARRHSRSNTATTAPALTLVRERDSGASASGDVVGVVVAATVASGADTRRGGLTWKRATSDGTELILTGQNSGGYEFGVSIARNGANSVDPTDPNLFALGGVNPWANIFTQNAVTVTSDARVKRDLGAPSEALLRAAAAVPIKLFQMLEAIAAKGEDHARIHAGVIAQEVKAAFEAEGLDPWRYGVLCADPWMETYEAVETVEEPVFKTVTEERVDHEVDAFGGVTLIRRTVEREVEDWNELPVFDEAGEPVWARKAADAHALVRDETGHETASVDGESVRVRRVQVEPDMVEGENGVVRLVPARAALQATHRVRATRFVQKTVTRERQKIDDNGEPMERLSVRYEPLMMLKLAALAAGIGA